MDFAVFGLYFEGKYYNNSDAQGFAQSGKKWFWVINCLYHNWYGTREKENHVYNIQFVQFISALLLGRIYKKGIEKYIINKIIYLSSNFYHYHIINFLHLT